MSASSQILAKLDKLEVITESIDKVCEALARLETQQKSMLKVVRQIKRSQDDPNGEKAAERSKTNGFNKPVNVSPDLAKFLGIKPDDLIPRSQVTKAVNEYINGNNLKDPEDRRKIICDRTLDQLLQPGDKQVTFLNLQRFLKVHYPTADAKE